MSLSQKSIDQLAEKIATKVVDKLYDEFSERVHTTISEIIDDEFPGMDEDLEMDLSVQVVKNIVFTCLD